MLCNGVVHFDDVTFIFAGSSSFLSEPGVCEQMELVPLLFEPHLFQLPKNGSLASLGM